LGAAADAFTDHHAAEGGNLVVVENCFFFFFFRRGSHDESFLLSKKKKSQVIKEEQFQKLKLRVCAMDDNDASLVMEVTEFDRDANRFLTTGNSIPKYSFFT